MPRILSAHGKVIAAEFQPCPTSVQIDTETLYHDGAIVLTRTTARIGHATLLVLHFLGDLETGAVVQLNNHG